MSSPQSKVNDALGPFPAYYRQLTLDETRNRRRAQRSQTRNPSQPTNGTQRSHSAHPKTLTSPATSHGQRSSSRQNNAYGNGFIVPFPISKSPVERKPTQANHDPDPARAFPAASVSQRDGSSGVRLPSPDKSASPLGTNPEDTDAWAANPNPDTSRHPGQTVTYESDNTVFSRDKNPIIDRPRPTDAYYPDQHDTHLRPEHDHRGRLLLPTEPVSERGSRLATPSDDGLSMMAAPGGKFGPSNVSREPVENGQDPSRFPHHQPTPEEYNVETQYADELDGIGSRAISPFPEDDLPFTPTDAYPTHIASHNRDRSPSPFPESPTPPYLSPRRANALPTRGPSHQTAAPFPRQPVETAARAISISNSVSKRSKSPPGGWLPPQHDSRRRSVSAVVAKSPLQQLERSLKEGGQAVEVKKRGYRRYPNGNGGNERTSVVDDTHLRCGKENEYDQDREFGDFGEDLDSNAPSVGANAWGDLRRRVGHANANRPERQGTSALHPLDHDNQELPNSPARDDISPMSMGWPEQERSRIVSPNQHQHRPDPRRVERTAPQMTTQAPRNTVRPPSPRTQVLSHPFITSVVGAPAGTSQKIAQRTISPMSAGSGPFYSTSRRPEYRASPLPDLPSFAPPEARFIVDSASSLDVTPYHRRQTKKLPLHLLGDDGFNFHLLPSELGGTAPSWVNKTGMGYWAHEKVPSIRVTGGLNGLARKAAGLTTPDLTETREMSPLLESPPPIIDKEAHSSDPTTFVMPSNDRPVLFNPPLYLKCGPLLRFCGTHSSSSRGEEVWRGTLLIVTLDSKSVYSPAPSVRLFFNTDVRYPKSNDPIAGTVKPSRIGKTLYVRPANDLIPGANLSAVENDGGLFTETPLDGAPKNDGSAWESALAADRSGSFSDLHATRLLSDKHATFWRFEIAITLRESATRVGYRLNMGPPLFFHVPPKGHGMKIAIHSRNGVAEIEKDRVEAAKEGRLDRANNIDQGLSIMCGPDPMWRDILNSHSVDPFHAMIGAGGQVVLDSAVKETIWFGDWWRKRLASIQGGNSDVSIPTVGLGLMDDPKRPGTAAAKSNPHLGAPGALAPNHRAGVSTVDPSGNSRPTDAVNGAGATSRTSNTMPPDMRAELELFFTLKYSAAFSHGLMSLAGSMIPGVNVWSEDGEGFRAFDTLDRVSPDMRYDPVVVEAWRISLKYYLLFQHHTLLDNGPASGRLGMSDSAFDHAWIPSPYISSLTGLPGNSFFLNMGKSMAFLALDSCSDRDDGMIIQPGTYEAVFARVNREIARGEKRHLVVCVGGPMVFPRKRNNFERREMGQRKQSVAKTIAGLFSDRDKQRAGAAGASDAELCYPPLPPSWTDPAFTPERRALVHMLQQLSREKGVRVTLLSCSPSTGVAAIGQFISRDSAAYSNRGARSQPKHRDYRYMPAIVAPSTAALPAGPLALGDLEIGTPDEHYGPSRRNSKSGNGARPMPVRRLSQSKKQNPRMLQFLQSSVYPLDGATDESMIPLFGDAPDSYIELGPEFAHCGDSPVTPYFMHRRGWCSIAEFVPGRSPAPSVNSDRDSLVASDLDGHLSDGAAAEYYNGDQVSPTKKNPLIRMLSRRRKSSGARKSDDGVLVNSRSVESWKNDEERVGGGSEGRGRSSFSYSRRTSGRRPQSSRAGPGDAPPRSFFNQFSCSGRDGCGPGIGPVVPLSYDGRPMSSMSTNGTAGMPMSPGMSSVKAESMPYRTSIGSRKDADVVGMPLVSNLPPGVVGRSGHNTARNSVDVSRHSVEEGPNPFRRRATIMSVAEMDRPVERSVLKRGNSIKNRDASQGGPDEPVKGPRRNALMRMLRRNNTTPSSTIPSSDGQSGPIAGGAADVGHSVDDLARQVYDSRLDVTSNGIVAPRDDNNIEGDDGDAFIDLRHGLDIRFCIERSAGAPDGRTTTFRMLVPALWDGPEEDGGRGGYADGVRPSMDSRRVDVTSPVSQSRPGGGGSTGIGGVHYPTYPSRTVAQSTSPTKQSPGRFDCFQTPPLEYHHYQQMVNHAPVMGPVPVNSRQQQSQSQNHHHHQQQQQSQNHHHQQQQQQQQRQDSPLKGAGWDENGVDAHRDGGPDGPARSYEIRRYPSYPKF